MTNVFSRRDLLGGSIASVAAASISSADERTAPDSVEEPQRSVRLVKTVDVLVCGGGPAGISAAIAAARAGATVQVLETHGCLGGVWTSGMLSYVIDADKPGFNKELLRRLDELDPQFGNNEKRTSAWMSYLYDVETMKFLLESLCTELAVGVQLHTRVVAVERHGKSVRGVITESKSGREAWRANVVIDATGDGDVGALAGCTYEIGREAGDETHCPCQPMSLMGVIAASPATLAKFNTAADGKNKDRLFEELKRVGVTPSYAKPTVWHMGGSIAAVMLNHEYGVRPDNAAAITDATIRARRELFDIVRALRQLPDWSDARLVTTAEQIGVRDGRRIRGRNFVTVEDIIAGRKQADGVCTSSFCVDVHALTKEANKKSAYGTHGVKAKPFDIPLSAMIAADVDNLMMAGRCISGDFLAHASYRVTGNSVAMGEAAGVTAALARNESTAPHEIAFDDVASQLNNIRREAGTL